MLGLYWDNENKMETTVLCWDYIGIMENKMETTVKGFRVYKGLKGSVSRSGAKTCQDVRVSVEMFKTICTYSLRQGRVYEP